ncbi:hypothetical protein JL722_2877 [Aureococcus anophagefferens]|nr:hypothetical protein JL722_2877 [Aureococcus anophagefferens]
MDAVGTKLKAKSARLASRRAAIVEEARERAASGEVYKGDGLLLDGKLDDDDGARAPPVAEALAKLAKTCVEESTGVGESSGDGRYAWGTWVDTDKVAAVVACADGVAPRRRALVGDAAGDFAAVRLAEGASWDVTLRRWTGDGGDVVQIFPPGSHVLLKPLRGTVELQKLRRGRGGEFAALGPKKELRGASAGLGGSAACGPVARVLGGPPQRLTARPGHTALLEVVLRPPVGAADEGKAALDADTVVADLDDARWAPLRDALVAAGDADAEETPEDAAETREAAAETREDAASAPTAATATNLRENVGGLEEQLDAIVRRVLASRADPEGAAPRRIVNGPEILDKFVGEAERKVRDLFQPAEDEYRQVGDASALHVIVFDEMDAIARRRGSLTGDTTGVRDGVVNQLLAKLDGVVAAPNVLVVGCTNRPELIDEALLRPGRLEIQLMRENGALAADAAALVEDGGASGLAARTELFSGAELAGLVRAAASHALQRPEKTVTEADLDRALREILATTEAEAAAAAPADARDDPMACDDAPAAADETDDSPRSVMAEAIDVGGSQQPRKEPVMSWPPPQPVRNGAGSWEKWQKWQALASNRHGGVLPPATYSTSPGDWAQHTHGPQEPGEAERRRLLRLPGRAAAAPEPAAEEEDEEALYAKELAKAKAKEEKRLKAEREKREKEATAERARLMMEKRSRKKKGADDDDDARAEPRQRRAEPEAAAAPAAAAAAPAALSLLTKVLVFLRPYSAEAGGGGGGLAALRRALGAAELRRRRRGRRRRGRRPAAREPDAAAKMDAEDERKRTTMLFCPETGGWFPRLRSSATRLRVAEDGQLERWVKNLKTKSKDAGAWTKFFAAFDGRAFECTAWIASHLCSGAAAKELGAVDGAKPVFAVAFDDVDGLVATMPRRVLDLFNRKSGGEVDKGRKAPKEKLSRADKKAKKQSYGR